MKIYNLGGSLGTVNEDIFWSMMPKVGDCFKVNDSCLLKCIQSDSKGLLFEELVIQDLPKQDYKCITINSSFHYPTLDFLYKLHDGEFVRFSKETYDRIVSNINTTLIVCKNMM